MNSGEFFLNLNHFDCLIKCTGIYPNDAAGEVYRQHGDSPRADSRYKVKRHSQCQADKQADVQQKQERLHLNHLTVYEPHL